MEIKVESDEVKNDKFLNKAINLSTTPPEEAAKNIDRSKLFDLSPDSYKDLKTELDPEAESIERLPAQVQPVTQQYVKQSEQHASLAKDDLKNMNAFEKRAKYYKEQILELPDLNRQINELTNKKITDGSLSEGEEEQLRDLNLTVQDISKSSNDIPGIGDTEKFGVEVVSAAGDFIRSYWENKEVLAAGIGGGTAVGALAGTFVLPALGTAAGATAGFTQSVVATSSLIGFLDGYTQMRGSVYNELSQATNDKGEPLNIPHERMALVSQGVGIISGIASGVAGKVLSSNNPFLKRFASPKLASKLIVGNAATLAKMEVLGGIAKSVMAEGGEEGLSEFVKIIGTNFAKMDESEASFMNALDSALESDSLKQIASSFAVGGATGGLIQSVSSAPGYAGMKKRFEEVQTVSKKRAEVLQAQNNFVELANDIKETKMQKLAPQEMSAFTKGVFSTLGIDESVWFTLDNLREFADTPEKGEAVRKVVDPNGELTKMAQKLNTPVEINKADLVQIITDFPELTDYMRLTPEGENPLEAKNNARNFVEKLTTAASKREEILASLGVDQEITPEIQAQLDEVSKIAEDDSVYSNRNDYIESQSFVEMEGILSKEEAETFNTTLLGAKLEVADILKEEVDGKFQAIENRIFRDVDAKDIQHDIKRLDSEFKVLERFNDRSVNAVTVEHKQKGFSPNAIDPKSLPEDLKEIYYRPGPKRDKLQKRKVFVEGGISVEESAALNGVESGAELLRILADTPSRNEVRTLREQRKIELRNRINQTIKPAKLRSRDDAFSNITKIRIKEMEYMRTKEWPTTKRGIIKIANKLPTIEGLNTQAKETINSLKIRELNPNRFKQGETATQKAALKNFLNAEFEQAYENKQKSALNNELRKEALNARDKIQKAENFWKKVNKPNIQQELKDAGMSDVMNDFLSVYKLDGAVKNEKEKQAFNSWVTTQVKNGNYTPVIPDRLDSTQVSYKDLTVEQYQAITEMGEYMVHQAKLKNKLLKLQENRAELRTAEAVATEIEEKTKANVNFDEKRAERKSERYSSKLENIKNGLKTSASVVSSIKTIVSELDEYKMGGYFHELIGKPIKEARTAKRQEMFNIESNDKKLIETFYGIDNFKKMFNEFRTIKEFDNIPTLGDGEGAIRKVDLLVLQAYMGDPEGRKAVENFTTRDGRRLTVEEVQTVLNRELDSNDAAFVQNFLVDRFKQFEQRSFDLHKRTTGVEPEMVKGIPVIHKDKVLPGGYYPIKRQMLTDEAKAAKFFDSLKEEGSNLFGEEESVFFARMRSAEMTQQGRLKERTGSDRPLDITFENVFDFTEEAIHDLNFREVGIDALKVLKNPINVTNMKAVVGPKKFTSLLNGVKDVVSKTTERESVLFAEEQGWINKLIQGAHSLHAVKAIGLNLTSAAIQADSLTNLLQRVGPKTGLYLMKSAGKIAANLNNYSAYVKLAESINPDIKFEKDGIDNAIVKQSYDFIPSSLSFFKKNKTASSQSIARIRDLQRKAIDASFSLVRESDRFNKVLTTMALSEQFLNGDIDGFSKEKVDAMSEQERAETMRKIVQQSIDLSLTASAPEDRTALEKNKVASIFVRYWTDRRSRLNTTLAQIDKVRGNIKRGENAKAASNLLTMGLAAGGSAAFIAMVRGKGDSILDALEEEEADDFAISLGWNFLKAPVAQTLETIPLIDSIKYQSDLEIMSDYRNVSTPLLGVASDVAMGVVALKDVLNMATRGKSIRLSDVQRKALLNNAGYLAGGVPTNGMFKAMEALQSKEVRKGSKYLQEEIKDLNKEIKTFINMFKDEKEAETFIEDLKEYQKTLPQAEEDIKDLVPENASLEIENILSGGDWQKFDKQTGASGIYQFTEERWNEIMNLNPDLGLTENGRVAKDPKQQRKAMDWQLQDNTRSLMAYEIPVDTKNLLGAHKFGFDNYIAIWSAKDNQKLSDILGEEVNRPEFDNFKTVKDVKEYLSRELKKTNN